MITTPATTRSHPARAFTLIELLVVVTILVAASVLLVPGFVRLLESTNYTNAVNTVSAALGQARAAAIRTGRHTGVAFFYDTTTDRASMQVIELLSAGGSGYLTAAPGYQVAGNYCQPFRPAEGVAPIELPRGTGVYGLSYAVQRTRRLDNTIIQPSDPDGYWVDNGSIPGASLSGPTFQWYSGELLDEGQAPTATTGTGEQTPWLFPRNDPAWFTQTGVNPWLTPRSQWGSNATRYRTAVRHAMTFCVIFDPTGSMVSATGEGGRALVNAYIELPDEPKEEGLASPGTRLALDNVALFDPENNGPSGAVELGANPEVRVRAAETLAVVDLRRMERELGIRRPWLVRPTFNANRQPPRREDINVQTFYSNENVRKVSSWIDRNAELLSFNRFSGNVVRRTPK
ncbi:MAG: type II secretion system protein [Planctomycetes bacterium]|nr:type II secretion system protein [Planctomycetota bacterium]